MSPEVSGKPSLKTVAQAAQVSTATVSNAYNRPEQLSGELRERILGIARQQGYAGPNPAASSLRSGRTGAIGVLLTRQLSYAFSDPYCVELMAGITDTAEASGTSMLLIPLAPYDPSQEDGGEEARRSVEGVARAGVDGFVADGTDDRHPALRVVAERGVPLVRTLDGASGPGARAVVIDEEGAARSVGEHLRELGHRSVAVLVDARADDDGRSGPVEESELSVYARRRLAGFRAGLGTEVAVVAAGPNVRQTGRRAAAAALDGDGPAGPVTALAATSDVLALGALDELHARGLVPGADISVTGFDDVAEAATAGLTTVHQPIREKGRVMARMLLEEGFTERRVSIPTHLVPRTSTGPAPDATRETGPGPAPQAPAAATPPGRPLRITVVVAGPRSDRAGTAIAGWLLARAGRRDDLRLDPRADTVVLADLDPDDGEQLRRRLQPADALVIVTPEQHHGYPGLLKTALDGAPEPWRRKPVALVGYGDGGDGDGTRAVEQLRAVLAGLDALSVRESLSFARPGEQLREDGSLRAPVRVEADADALLTALHWWATALRAARTGVPA